MTSGRRLLLAMLAGVLAISAGILLARGVASAQGLAVNPDGSYGDVAMEPNHPATLACEVPSIMRARMPEMPLPVRPAVLPDPPGPGCENANLQTTAVATSSGGGAGTYGPALAANGVFGTGGENPTCCVSGNCWAWISAGIYPTAAWFQLEWPAPIEVGQIFVDTKPVPAECDAGNNRALHGADIQTWDGAAWVTHGSVTTATDDWGFTIPGGPVTTTRLRLNRLGVVNTSSQASNPILYELKVYRCSAAIGGEVGPGVDPNRQLGRQVHLPILNFQGQDDVCRTWIEVQVVGPEFSKAVLVTWGEPGFCPPQCAGPLKVECTGLLKPGSTWNFLGAQIPTGSKSGMLFKFTSKQLSVVAPDLVPPDDIVADYMCETLFFGVVGDCDDYRRFKKAYNEGLEFAGINMKAAAGLGILAVDVLRHCPGDVTPGVEVSSKYNGIAGDHLGSFDPVFGGYGFYVPLLYADKAGFNSIMYIQNGGLECSSIEIWFKAQDDCLRARICEVLTLAPGETYQFDASDCVGPDWQGSSWIRSTQPLGIVVDIIGRDVLMTYMGEPAEYNYPADPNDEKSKDVIFTVGNQVAFGPLMYSEYQGWDTGVQVQNMSPIVNAKVKVYFLDRSGDIITTLVDWICPRGSQTFFLPVVADLPGNWVGSIRVESQEWWTPGAKAVAAPNIVGVATLIKYSDAARTQTTEAIAYSLVPEHKIYRWQIGSGVGGVYSGVALIAIPSLLKDLDGTGITSELAITNIVPKPGFTDFAVYIYDQNGLLDMFCQKLNEKQVEYINLQTWGYVNPGFKGSAIISAVFWEHDVFGPAGEFLRNVVGLGAVAIERTGTRLGEDVPGDEAAGERGIPFAAKDKKEFDWEGPNLPNCPGIGRIPVGGF